MISTKVFGRIRLDVPESTDHAEVLLPGGGTENALIFKHNDADFTYDRHGYETVTLRGNARKQIAFTPVVAGKHVLRAYEGEKLLAETEFDAEASGLHGFVEVSKKDPRYFVFSDGSPYVAIGLNVIGAGYDRLPAGGEFELSEETATMGMMRFKRWFKEMKAVGANYARIWLSGNYTEARTGIMGVHDPVALARFDALIELAREYGIYLKLCFEHWRTFSKVGHFTYRYYIDPETGKQFKDENEWFNSPKWNARWLKDIEPYVARCQNDPVVFAWELWNEIDCGVGSFDSVYGFTQRMLREVKLRSPKNLVVNSLGSLDEDYKQERQDAFRDMPEMDFQQAHRYLDQGAPLEICRTDPIEFSIDAVNRVRREDKPVILTETGAVNDRHVGAFRFYGADHDGLIFHDVTYPAFFAGAAGCGHIWHTNLYVEPNNLWRHYRPLVNALSGVRPDEEGFAYGVVENDNAWILTMNGRCHTLALIRNKADRWDKVLLNMMDPAPVQSLLFKSKAEKAEAFWLMDEAPGDLEVSEEGIRLPDFVHGCVLKIKNKGLD